MSLTFNAEQGRILVRLVTAGAQTTGDLARQLRTSPPLISHALLPLRTEGIVFSTRGVADQHVTWQLTQYGKDLLYKRGLETYHTLSVSEKEKEKPRKYILWCPTSDKAPTVTYPSLDKAKEVQKIMAGRYPGQVFHICEVQDGLRAVVSTTLEEV